MLEWLRSAVGGFGTRDVEDVQARLVELQRLGAEQLALPDLPLERLRAYARAIVLRKPSTLGRLRDPRRTVEIGCWLRLQLLTLTDTVLEQTSRRVGELWARARQTVEAGAPQELNRYRGGMEAICAALRDPSLDLAGFRARVETAAGPFLDRPPSRSNAQAIREEMAREPARLRALLKQVVGLQLSLDVGHPLTPVLEALRQVYEGARGPLPAAAIGRLPPVARRPIEEARSAGAKLAAFEVAAAMLLKRSLRNGEACAPHSVRHRAVDDQLMPKHVWEAERGRTVRAGGWPGSLEGYVRRFEQPLALRLEMLAEAVATGAIGLENGALKVPRVKADPVEPGLIRLREDLLAAIGPTQLPDLLVEVDGRVRFSWTLLGRPPATAQELRTLYCGLLALGTDESAAAMARMVDGASADQIAFAMRQIEESGRLRAANDALSGHLLGLPIAKHWGSGVMASADMMSLDATRHLWTARIEPRRRRPAVGTYTHILDRWAIIYDQPIVLNRRQAGVAIEGALAQDLADLQRLAVDTHGFTHFAMAVAKFLGFDLCPRLADLNRRKLYLPRGVPVPATLEPIVERLTVGAAARRGWDAFLRLVASLKGGYGSASNLLDRHGSAAHGTPIYECGTTIGKLLRSLFLLDYLVNPAFQRAIQRVLSQGEAVHPLQRALMPGRIEAKHGRTAQEHAAISGALTLLTNAVMAWNAERMHRVASADPARFSADRLSHIAPVAHRHINMNGIMRFRIDETGALLRHADRPAGKAAN